MSEPAMLYEELRALADRVEAGELAGVDAAKALRELATHQPDERCTGLLSNSRYLARVEEPWTWALVEDPSGIYGGVKLISNRYTPHVSNLGTVIDFHWWNPADIDTLGRALCAAAEIEQANLLAEDGDEG